jgi:SAM-dependent methyltransferase
MTGLSDARLPASMVGFGAGESPWLAMLANTQSEPPYAVLGLGTGILGCYAKPYQHVDIYEIDPLVKQLSIVPGYVPPWDPKRSEMPKDLDDPVFYFVHDAQERWANINVILGDGRLKIRDAHAEKYYHVIALDAFSSDAIPVHLLTKEAIEIYLSKLAPGGVLLFNTTNRYVRIEGVLAALAEELDCDCLYCPDYTWDSTDHPDRFSADWVVLQPRMKEGSYKTGGRPIRERLEADRVRQTWYGKVVKDEDGKPVVDRRWQEVNPLPGPVWTDGYSNLLNPRIMPWIAPWKRR